AFVCFPDKGLAPTHVGGYGSGVQRANRFGEISPSSCYRSDEGVVLWSRDGVAGASRPCGSVKPALAGTRNSRAGRPCHYSLAAPPPRGVHPWLNYVSFFFRQQRRLRLAQDR